MQMHMDEPLATDARSAGKRVDTARSICTASLLTARTPGAIAIVQLHGDVVPLLLQVTSVSDWPIGRMRLVNLAGVDEGLAVRLGESIAQFMPHGGIRVIERLMQKLLELGVKLQRVVDADPKALYPEAADSYEAMALAALARAASPQAIDLLLRAPAAWRALQGQPLSEMEQARSQRLNRLIDPPLVVVAGPPNVGKSTLSNLLLGRSMSLAVDMPGTTRDYTSALIELRGLVVRWHDTPGIRRSDDPIEMKAIELARVLIEQADLLVSISDAENDWLGPPDLPRKADLMVVNKVDIAGRSDGDLQVSARTGEGIADLVQVVRDVLVPPEDTAAVIPERWIYDPRLEEVEHARGSDRAAAQNDLGS